MCAAKVNYTLNSKVAIAFCFNYCVFVLTIVCLYLFHTITNVEQYKKLESSSLFFPLFNVALPQDVSFAYVQHMLHGLTFAQLCVHVLFADNTIVNFW